MVHTFQEIRTRTPANPKQAAPGGCHAAGGMGSPLPGRGPGPPPPQTPEENPRRWLQTTHYQAWAINAPQPPPPSHHNHTRKVKGKGKGRAREGKGHPGQGARRGPR